jgi:hypothetical protein
MINWVISDDVENQLLSFTRTRKDASLGAKLGTPFSFNDYHRMDDVYAKLEEYSAGFPEEVFVTTIGKSFEGRDIKMVRLTDGIAANNNKKVIFIDGGERNVT